MTNHNPWKTTKSDGFTITYTGDTKDLDDLPALLQKSKLKDVSAILQGTPRHFGIIIEHEDFVFASVDKIRSTPIVYEPETGKASGTPLEIKSDFTADADETALLQFCMAGYILGQETLYQNLKSLQAGECFFFDKKKSASETIRYYQYAPKPKDSVDKEEAMAALGTALDAAIHRTMENANGRKIWIPLSGGLDSRIVVAKLHDFGYDNIELFSYGMKGNEEAQIAKEAAERLGIKWTMYPSQPAGARALFKSELQKQYEDFAHAYCTIPSYVEFEAINTLKKTGLTQEGDFIVNGQSGDYICGAHIPAVLYENDNPTHQDMIDFTIGKHFSLWENLKTPENIEILTNLINEHLIPASPDLSEKDNLICQYESFEWAERQCKMVVHGQRVYDFFGFNWSLPLWDGQLIDVFETMPLDLKYQRKLFRDYVARYNYRTVFELPTAVIKTWQPPTLYFMMGVGKLLELTRGLEHKQDFYKKMSYYGHARNQFSLFDKSLHDKHYKDMRNMISLSILEFIDRYELPFPEKTNAQGQ